MVAIARALLNDNRVLLVDEPTKGLAPLLVTEVARVLERVSELTTVLLVEQNLGVVAPGRARRRRARHRPGRAHRPGAGAARRQARWCSDMLGVGADAMSTFVLLTITGLGLGAMYFLIASGLSLIYGLMGVLNFAHGAFLTVGAYAMWFTESKLDGVADAAALPARRAGRRSSSATVFAALVELVLIRPLYGRHIEQVLVTVGLALAIDRARRPRSGGTTRASSPLPTWLGETTTVLGAHIPNDRWIEIVDGGRRARSALERVPAAHPLRPDHPRRRREPRDGDGARHRRAHAPSRSSSRSAASPRRSPECSRTSTSARSIRSAARRSLIFAFIVVVIGGLGSLRGTALAAVVVGLVQQYANYYASSGLGDLSVVLLLGLVLLVRPRGLSGSFA